MTIYEIIWLPDYYLFYNSVLHLWEVLYGTRLSYKGKTDFSDKFNIYNSGTNKSQELTTLCVSTTMAGHVVTWLLRE